MFPQQLLSDYSTFVDTLFSPGAEVLDRLTPEHVQLIHAALGVSGEAGELVDAVKKSIFYDRPLDTDNIKEELGDILFYVQAVAALIDSGLDEVIRLNQAKLRRRYPTGIFSTADAQARADKV